MSEKIVTLNEELIWVRWVHPGRIWVHPGAALPNVGSDTFARQFGEQTDVRFYCCSGKNAC